MKKAKLVFTVLILLSLSLSVIGCGNTKESVSPRAEASSSQKNVSTDIQGTWLRENSSDKVCFNADGTFEFESSGMYSDSGTYSISADSELTMNSSASSDSYAYLSLEEMKQKTTGKYWCIEDDKLYLGSTTNYYVR